MMTQKPQEAQQMGCEDIEKKQLNVVKQAEEKVNVKQTFSNRKKLYIAMGIVISTLVVAGIVAAAVLIVDSQKDKETNLFKNKSAIIVGAGSAGLSAAHQLNEKGIKVEILEARATHFGRIQKLDEKGWADFDVEMGAEELHYENSWYGNQIKKQVPKTKESWQDYDQYVAYGQDPATNLIKKIDDINKDTAHESHFEIFEKGVEDKTIKDQTMQEYLATFNKYDANQYHIYNSYYGQEYGTTLYKIGTKGIGQAEISFDEDVSGHTFKVAHSDMLTKIFEKVITKVKYNIAVTQINYENSKVKLTDAAGNTYEADYVIVCVPLTQLKKKAITFTPAVSASKQAAIDQLEMDPAVKLHFKFTERFWAEDTFDIIVKGTINYCWDGNQWRKKSFVLTCLFMGANTADFEAKKDKYINLLITNLGVAYNKNVKPLLDSYRYKNWGAEPYIEGGYSLPGVDEGTSRVDLQKQINDKIFFAGEATHQFFYQTVNGAIDTGITAANEIIKIIEK